MFKQQYLKIKGDLYDLLNHPKWHTNVRVEGEYLKYSYELNGKIYEKSCKILDQSNDITDLCQMFVAVYDGEVIAISWSSDEILEHFDKGVTLYGYLLDIDDNLIAVAKYNPENRDWYSNL